MPDPRLKTYGPVASRHLGLAGAVLAARQPTAGANRGNVPPWPRAEDAENYYVMGMDEDLNLALKNAVLEAVDFFKRRGLGETEAYSLASIGVHFAVAEAVDQNLVIYGMIPKALFKTNPAYWRQ